MIVAVDFSGNFLESADGANWTLTPGSRDPFSALTKLDDGTLVAVGSGGAIWRSPEVRPPLPLRIVSAALAEGEEGELVEIEATGTPRSTYRLVSSADCVRWSEETTVTPDETEFDVLVGKPADGEYFYRLEEIAR